MLLAHPSCEFVVADALQLNAWWQEQGYATKYHKPLVICVNNTINIMPHELRGNVIDQMIAVAGTNGLCMISYWNGTFCSSFLLFLCFRFVSFAVVVDKDSRGKHY